MTLSSQWVEVQGARTHYLTAGSGEPVFLLHGGGTDSASLSWKLPIGPLAEHFHVFAPDWPGYGESDRPAIAYTMEYYIGFLRSLLDALGVAQASLVGASMGGGIALGFALQFPERMRRLVLVDSYGLQATAPGHRASYLLVHIPGLVKFTWALTKGSRALARASLQSLFHDPSKVSEELVEEVLVELKKPGTGKAFLSFQKSEVLWSGLRTVYLDRLQEIRAPTLIVHGAEDRLVPVAWARLAHERIQGSYLHIIPNCGHWPQRENPEEFRRALLTFLVG